MDKLEIGKRIKNIRLKRGLTMDKFGETIDKTNPVKSGVVSNWENGKQVPNNTRLKKIAELGNTNIDYLLYGDLISFLINNLSVENVESLKGYDLSGLNRNGKNMIVQKFYDEYLSMIAQKNITRGYLSKHEEIADYNDVLTFAKENTVNIIVNMVEYMRKSIKSLEDYNIKDIARLSDLNPLYEKYVKGEIITETDLINNYMSINKWNLEHQIYKSKNNNYIASVISDLLKYNSILSRNAEIDDDTLNDIVLFLRSNMRISDESDTFNNTILEGSNLHKYIKYGALDDLEIINKKLDAIKNNQ